MAVSSAKMCASRNGKTCLDVLNSSYNCNWGTPNDFATTLFKGDLYVGNWNPFSGEIWKMDGRH